MPNPPSALRPPTSVPPADAASGIWTGQNILFVGDLRRLKVNELSTAWLFSPGVAPDLLTAHGLLSTSPPGKWQVIVIDSQPMGDADLVAFCRTYHENLRSTGTRIIILLAQRQEYVRERLAPFAEIADPTMAVEALATLLRLPRSATGRKAAHVMVLSAKGGSGKTSAALAIAEYIAKERKDWNIIVVDTDLFDGNVAQSLGIEKRAKSILDLAQVARSEGWGRDVLNRFLTPTDWGIRVLAAPATSTYRSGHVDPGVVAALYDGLQQLGADLIVSDAPPDIRQGTPVSPVFFAPDMLPTSYIGLLLGPRRYERDGFNRMVDYLRAKDALGRAWLIYLQSRPFRRELDIDLTSRLQAVAEENNLRGVLGNLPFDPATVEDAQNEAVPFWAIKPKSFFLRLQWQLAGGSPFQRAAAAMAHRLLDIIDAERKLREGKA